jgi:hypothetical protein
MEGPELLLEGYNPRARFLFDPLGSLIRLFRISVSKELQEEKPAARAIVSSRLRRLCCLALEVLSRFFFSMFTVYVI